MLLLRVTQVSTLAERFADLEEHVADLSTDLRLQARRSAVAAQVPSLSLSHAASHDGSAVCSASASPRGEFTRLRSCPKQACMYHKMLWCMQVVPLAQALTAPRAYPHPAALCPAVAGPISAPTPTGKGRSRHVSLVGASSAGAAVPEASTPVGSALSPRVVGPAAPALPSTPGAAAAGPGGVFGLIKSWGDDQVRPPAAAASATTVSHSKLSGFESLQATCSCKEAKLQPCVQTS